MWRDESYIAKRVMDMKRMDEKMDGLCVGKYEYENKNSE
jgi:hypothetical protein